MGKNKMLPKVGLQQAVLSAEPRPVEQPLSQESHAVGDPVFRIEVKLRTRPFLTIRDPVVLFYKIKSDKPSVMAKFQLR